MTTIGLTLPLQRGNSGYFQQSYDSLTQIRSNLLNFFNTRPLERRFNPKFGTRLYNFLFEQQTDDFEDILKNIIREDINIWFPNVFVNQVFLEISSAEKNNDINNYIIRVKVQFTYNKETSSFSFVTTTTNI